MESTDSSNTNFFKYVFNFDSDSKANILNVMQYSLIALIPMTILIKLMQTYIPEADEKKSSLEIIAEVVIQTIYIFVGLIFVHRIIEYIPTYSGVKYPPYNATLSVLAVFVTIINFQTRIGEKINILIDRLTELWEGNNSSDKKKSKNKKSNNAQQQQGISTTQTSNQSAMNQSLYTDGTSINSLPTSDITMTSASPIVSQQLPDYNNMYRKDNTPLVGAATPGQSNDGGGFMEPMAANSVLGGGSFGSW